MLMLQTIYCGRKVFLNLMLHLFLLYLNGWKDRYYGVKLAYPEEMESMKLYGSLDLQCSLEEVLRRISLTAPISFQKMDNEIEIHINNVHKNN